MKYDMTARVYGMVFRRILASYYKKHVLEMSASARRDVFRRIQKEYKAMLERTPGVGGKASRNSPRYCAPARMLSAGSSRLLTLRWSAVSSVNIIIPRTPVGLVARGFHCDSW